MSSLEREEGKTVIYTSIGSDWKRFGHPRRYLQLLLVIVIIRSLYTKFAKNAVFGIYARIIPPKSYFD